MTSDRTGILSALVAAATAIAKTFRPARKPGPATVVVPSRPTPGRDGSTETVELDPRSVRGLRVAYAPHRDGAPDAGEIVWTWVPYAERDGRGKDRPVLVVARQSADRVYAVKLTSKSHDGDRDFLSLGSGPWDGQGRESWVDIDQLYSVHVGGVRREAAALDRGRFARVASVLERRFGWTAAA
ncbi:type II toxin-antitoxin system PemK/MazF family toxin [Microbacterium sp. 22242]|uniref:type II toxin-antitoxin system PemK/MazF family toxin n=1 Tax=Microbacterium sp. 22242 TaxID=3453896 RepID=UPI003F83FE4E